MQFNSFRMLSGSFIWLTCKASVSIFWITPKRQWQQRATYHNRDFSSWRSCPMFFFFYIMKYVSQLFSFFGFWLHVSALVLGGAPQFFPLALFLQLYYCGLCFLLSFSPAPSSTVPSDTSAFLVHFNSVIQWQLLLSSNILPTALSLSPLPLPAGCSSACIVLRLAPALSAIRGPGEQTLAQILILWMGGCNRRCSHVSLTALRANGALNVWCFQQHSYPAQKSLLSYAQTHETLTYS